MSTYSDQQGSMVSPEPPAVSRSMFFSFFSAITKPFRWHIAGLLAGEAVWSLDMALRPYLIKIVLDQLALHGVHCPVSTLVTPIGLYLMLVIAIELGYRLYDLLSLSMMPRLKQSVVVYLMDHVMRHSHRYFQDNFAGDLANKINDVALGTKDIIERGTDQFFSYGLGMCVAIYTLSLVHPIFGFLGLSWVLVMCLISGLSVSRAHALAKEAAQAQGSLTGNIVDVVSNMHIVRLFANRLHERSNIGQWTEKCVQKEQALKWFLFKVWIVRGFCFVAIQAICLAILIYGYKQGRVTIGDFALILTLNTSITDSLWYLAEEVALFCEHLGKINQGLRAITAPSSVRDYPDVPELVVTKGEVSIHNLTFRHESGDQAVTIPELHIPGGQRVGIVGHSGSGKTTFMHLVARIVEPQVGTILIDGQSTKNVTLASLHGQLTVVPQEPLLLHRSLLENIRYGNLYATDAEVIHAAQKAHAHHFIEQLPDGYRTIIGERGTKLSGGQRQLIAIARAFLKQSSIIMLDEATSALDVLTEQHVRDGFAALSYGRTTFVAAHRLSTLIGMDRILVFEQGQLVQDGSHELLLSTLGIYRNLWLAQQRVEPLVINQSWPEYGADRVMSSSRMNNIHQTDTEYYQQA